MYSLRETILHTGFTALFVLVLVVGCTDRDNEPSTKGSSKLSVDEVLIATFQVEPGGAAQFDHEFTEPQWIGFKTNISREEIDRFDREEDAYSSVELRLLGSNKFVGSHSGAATVFTPNLNNPNQFEITNRSREQLEVMVYWKPE